MGCCSSHPVEAPSTVSRSRFVKKRQGTFQHFYEFQENLGTGAFGAVYRVKERRSGLIRAMKEVRKSQISEEQRAVILNEINLLTELDHPNIMKIYEYIESEKFFYIVCEALTGGELFNLIKKCRTLPEETTAKYIKDALSGIFYIHSMGIVHNDLKPENLLLENSSPSAEVKIIDFGIARKLGKEPLFGMIGTVS